MEFEYGDEGVNLVRPVANGVNREGHGAYYVLYIAYRKGKYAICNTSNIKRKNILYGDVQFGEQF